MIGRQGTAMTADAGTRIEAGFGRLPPVMLEIG